MASIKKNAVISLITIGILTFSCCSKYSEEDFRQAVEKKDYTLLAKIALGDNQVGCFSRSRFSEDMINLVVVEKKRGIIKMSAILDNAFPVLKKALNSKDTIENNNAILTLTHILAAAGIPVYKSELYRVYKDSKILSLSKIVMNHSNGFSDPQKRQNALFLLHSLTLHFGNDMIAIHKRNLIETFMNATKNKDRYVRSQGYFSLIMINDIYHKPLNRTLSQKLSKALENTDQVMKDELIEELYVHYDKTVQRLH